jgi:hypothetical protein
MSEAPLVSGIQDFLFRTGTVRLAIHAARHTAVHNPKAMPISFGSGEKTSTKPRPFTSAEKLETQKGIMNSRTVGQKPSFTAPGDAVVLI